MNKEERNAYADKGIDDDLRYCLEYNPQSAFSVDDIVRVLAVWEGMNDADAWVWILELANPLYAMRPVDSSIPADIEQEYQSEVRGRFVILWGRCDFTGWDCLSYADHEVAISPTSAVNMLFKWFNDIPKSIRSDRDSLLAHRMHSDLLRQLRGGKSMTWREQKNIEFGITDAESDQ